MGERCKMNVLEKISVIAGKYFAVWVIIAAVISYLLPNGFLFLGSYITILLGIVMFGMGLTLEPVDFKLVVKNPVPVIIGVIAQFVVMPLTALGIAYILNLPNELAAGLVLLGSVPGGTAPNVMVYLARGNLRSEEHTSELQSRGHLVCRLLLERQRTPLQ